MYKDLIKNICEKEGLVDIGRLGKASQSSCSKWSYDNDAQRAVDGNDYPDFAFHTDKELNPWWNIEWDREFLPSYIIISNRKSRAYRHISASIKVSINNTAKTLHEGLVYYGSAPDSLPLIIPLNGKINIQSLKVEISNSTPAALHLSKIQVLAKKPLRSENNQPLFFANRKDGFGMRLFSILTAMIYAKKYDTDYMFTWKYRKDKGYENFQMIDKADSIFSKSFLSHHLIEEGNIELNRLHNASSYNVDLHDDSFVGYICDHSNRFDYKKLNINYKPTDAFNDLKFNEKLKAAKNLAENINLGSKVAAIHLRSGDIVYEDYRKLHSFHYKVIPAYVIPKLIGKLKDKGYTVVLVGQEKEFCQYLSNKLSVFYAEDLVNDNFNDAQRGLFDITLLSRMDLVVTMGSAFTQLACEIGEVPRTRYQSILSEYEIKEGFVEYEKGIGALSDNVLTDKYKSFSYINFYRNYGNSIKYDKRLEILDKCIKLEPDNILNKFLRKVESFECLQTVETHKELMDFIGSSEGRAFLNKFVSAKQSLPPVDYVFKEYKERFQKLASQGVVAIALILLMHEKVVGETIDSKFYLEVMKKAERRSLGYTDKLISELKSMGVKSES